MGIPGARRLMPSATVLLRWKNGLVAVKPIRSGFIATARWIKGDDKTLGEFASFNRANLAKDRDGDMVFMAKSPWDVTYQVEKNPQLTFSATKER